MVEVSDTVSSKLVIADCNANTRFVRLLSILLLIAIDGVEGTKALTAANADIVRIETRIVCSSTAAVYLFGIFTLFLARYRCAQQFNVFVINM